MKTLIACTMHIFFYNFFNVSDVAETSDLRVSASKTLESHDNDWTSAPFQTTFDLPKDITILVNKVGIHFPADAAQPPSDQVRIFANLSGGSEVTDWYMRAFGLMPLPESSEYVKAGWSEEKSVPIINLSDSMNGTKVSNPSYSSNCRFRMFLSCFNFGRISRRELFIREFRKIADNPIGRALLYRILIEIRRHKPNSSPGIVENHYKIESLHESDLNLTSLKEFREHSRCLNINWNQDNFNFSPSTDHIATLNFNNTTIQKTHVTSQLEDSGNFLIQPQPSCIVDDLFHELLHWYHLLRDPLRFYLDGCNFEIFIDRRLGTAYYNWVTTKNQNALSTIA